MFKEGDEYRSQVYGTQKVREGEYQIVSGSVQIDVSYVCTKRKHSIVKNNIMYMC